MQSDPAAFSARYAAASDEEVLAAWYLGKAAFQPEAWDAITYEIGRRRIVPGRRERRRRTKQARQEWTLGLRIGLGAALLILSVIVPRMIALGVLPGRRAGGVFLVGVLFLGVWFGVAMLVDIPKWWPNTRGRRPGRADDA